MLSSILQVEISRDEKWSRSRETKESVNKTSYCIEPLASRRFPLKEKADPVGISSNAQNKLKGREHYVGQSKMSIGFLSLADKQNDAAIREETQKGWPHYENDHEGKAEKRFCSLLRLQKYFGLLNHKGKQWLFDRQGIRVQGIFICAS
jgi:hypothetical protein